MIHKIRKGEFRFCNFFCKSVVNHKRGFTGDNCKEFKDDVSCKEFTAKTLINLKNANTLFARKDVCVTHHVSDMNQLK